MISVLILTHNEEVNLPACLESVKWCDDVVVFDSFSTDRTVEIARAAGARVLQRKFDNERNQRTESLKVGFKYGWVYNPDADEVTPADLRDEMFRVVADPNPRRQDAAAYRVRFRVIFLGKWIRNSSLYPTWVVRLFRPDKVRFERDINLRYVIDGREGRLRHHFLHFSFRKGIADWFRKHNKYSDDEAREAIKVLARGKLDWPGMASFNPVRRRAALKDLSFRIPFRAPLIFVYLMLIRGGLFDGPAGWTYCRMRAYYEFLIGIKIREHRLRERGQPA